LMNSFTAPLKSRALFFVQRKQAGTFLVDDRPVR
jgi:hypothetical protein